MNPNSKSTDRNDYQRIPQRIGAMPREFAKGFHNPLHAHERTQLIYASSGVMEIRAGGRQWILSPETALLMPRAVLHEMTALSRVSLRTLFIACAGADFPVPGRIMLIHVTGLLKELIREAISLPMAYDENGVAGKVMDLILYEISRHQMADSFTLPMATAAPLLFIEREIMADHGRLKQPVEYWASALHISAKTLNRLVQRELGINFRLWKQYLAVKIGLVMMAESHSPTLVAYELGYASLPAFSKMFKKITGQSPSEFQRCPS